MPLAASRVARQAPTGKPPPSALAKRHDVGRDAGALIGEQFAGAAHAALHLVEDQQQAVLVAQLAQRPEERRLDDAHAALAHQRLDQDRGGLGADGALDRLEIAKRHMVKALDHRAEAVEYFFCPPAASVASVRPWKAPSKVMMR